jgi:hypothetical protein
MKQTIQLRDTVDRRAATGERFRRLRLSERAQLCYLSRGRKLRCALRAVRLEHGPDRENLIRIALTPLAHDRALIRREGNKTFGM